MSKVKLTLLCLLAVVVAGAVASSSASAEACKKEEGSKKYILCLGEPLTLTEGTLTIDVAGKSGYTLATENHGPIIECTFAEGSGSLNSTVAKGVKISKLVIKFTSCLVPEHCTLTKALVTKALNGVVEEKEKFEYTPAVGTTFMEIGFEGKECIIPPGTYSVTTRGGKGVLCTVPIEVTRVEQLFTCAKANSSLMFGAETATFEGNLPTFLVDKGVDAKWAVIEGK